MKYIFGALALLLFAACGSYKQWPCTPCKKCDVCPPAAPMPPAHVSEAKLSEFTVTLAMADHNTLGLYLQDDTEKYSPAIFKMPELGQKETYDHLLILTKPDKSQVEIGNLNGEGSPLMSVSLCENEFSADCKAVVTLKGTMPETLEITLADQTHFSWTRLGAM